MAASDLDRAYDYCQRVARARARNFYYVIRMLPRPKRRAIYATYAVCRLWDDIADDDMPSDRKRALFVETRRSLASAFIEASGGANGRSSRQTPEFVALSDTARAYNIPPQYFGEALSLVDRRLIMLTWRAQRAFSYDRDSFELLDTYRYRGEGWGLCYDGDRLIMSDGSDRLTFRDPVTFEPIGEQRVRLRGRPLYELNELECVDGAVYANVWQTDFIVRIDPADGRVTDYIDAAGLLQGADRLGAEVLNGIAWDPEADTFYITGKWWPKMFEVRFVEAR